MEYSQYNRDLEEENKLLKTKVRHLQNDLRLTKEENEKTTKNYFEIYTHIEKKVEERTEDIITLQKALEQKGHELEVMLDSSPAIIFYKDNEQRLLRVNKKYSEIIGLPINEILGKRSDNFFSQKKDAGLEKDIEVIEQGRPILNELEYIQTCQGERQVRMDRIPYKGINHEVLGLIGFALDVTDLTKAEEEKSRLEAKLQHIQRME